MKLIEMFDTRLKNFEIKKERGHIIYIFNVEGNSEINPNPVDVEYRVSFSSPRISFVPCFIGAGMKALMSTLTFKNSLTGMQTYQSKGYKDVNQNIIFSTIAAMVIHYFEKNGKTQGITFTAAHLGLHKAYKILSKEAERKGPLKWTNPGPTEYYYIVRKDIWEKYENIVQKGQE